MNNLIYIVYDRGFRLATYDFEKAINSAFNNSSLVIYDMDNKNTLLDFYCTEDTLCELESELIEKGLMDLVPNCKVIFKEVADEHEKMCKRRERHNRKVQEDREYEIYLKVKERLALD